MASARASSSSTDPRLGASQRALAGLISLAAIAVLGLAAWMSPEGAGHGTHEQIGLPVCAWAQYFDAPCMTCGMTTAFAHAADGDLLLHRRDGGVEEEGVWPREDGDRRVEGDGAAVDLRVDVPRAREVGRRHVGRRVKVDLARLGGELDDGVRAANFAARKRAVAGGARGDGANESRSARQRNFGTIRRQAPTIAKAVRGTR